MKKCVCGKMKDDDAVFCPYCGSREFAEEPAAEPAPAPRYQEEQAYQNAPQAGYQPYAGAPAGGYQGYQAPPQEQQFRQVKMKPAKAKPSAPDDVPGSKHSAKSIMVFIFGICSLVLGGLIVRLGLGIAGMLIGKKEAENGQIFGYYGRKLSMIGIIVCIASLALSVIGAMLFSSYVSSAMAYILSLIG